jgi:hypothetical protein
MPAANENGPRGSIRTDPCTPLSITATPSLATSVPERGLAHTGCPGDTQTASGRHGHPGTLVA